MQARNERERADELGDRRTHGRDLGRVHEARGMHAAGLGAAERVVERGGARRVCERREPEQQRARDADVAVRSVAGTSMASGIDRGC